MFFQVWVQIEILNKFQVMRHPHSSDIRRNFDLRVNLLTRIHEKCSLFHLI